LLATFAQGRASGLRLPSARVRRLRQRFGLSFTHYPKGRCMSGPELAAIVLATAVALNVADGTLRKGGK
jgi:orotate phosphoribosyltransferase